MAELLEPLKEEMMMKLIRKLLGVVALFAMFGTMNANAQTADLDVSAEVPEACIITSSDPLVMAFGTVDPIKVGQPVRISPVDPPEIGALKGIKQNNMVPGIVHLDGSVTCTVY